MWQLETAEIRRGAEGAAASSELVVQPREAGVRLPDSIVNSVILVEGSVGSWVSVRLVFAVLLAVDLKRMGEPMGSAVSFVERVVNCVAVEG